MIVSAHQPHYLPWLRYFGKIAKSDIFILLDDIQYNKGGYQNRNFIKGSGGKVRLTVPVKHRYQESLLNVQISPDPLWRLKHLRSLEEGYRTAFFFHSYISFFEELYAASWEYLTPLNEHILNHILSFLGITTTIVKSSQLKSMHVQSADPEGRRSPVGGPAADSGNETLSGTDRLIRLVKETGGSFYLAGAYGMGAYLDRAKMEEAGIKVLMYDWKCPIYKQQFSEKGFIPELSIVDLLFNEGNSSLNILLNGGKIANVD